MVLEHWLALGKTQFIPKTGGLFLSSLLGIVAGPREGWHGASRERRMAGHVGLNTYKSDFQVYLRNLILQLSSEYETVRLVIIMRPLQYFLGLPVHSNSPATPFQCVARSCGYIKDMGPSYWKSLSPLQ